MSVDLSAVNPGELALYVPHQAHALMRDIHGQFAWVIGRKRTYFDHTARAEKTVVEEFADDELGSWINYLKNAPAGHPDRQAMVLVRPKVLWPAVVRGVCGSCVDLDVQSCNGGVTLHENAIAVDPTRSTAHTACLLLHMGDEDRQSALKAHAASFVRLQDNMGPLAASSSR